MTDELTSMVLGIARSAVVASTAGYEAGREQGFRDGVKAAADAARDEIVELTGHTDSNISQCVVAKIRGLRHP